MSFYPDSSITANTHKDTLWIEAIDERHDQAATFYLSELQAKLIHAMISARYPHFLDVLRAQVRMEMEIQAKSPPLEPIPIPTSDVTEKQKV